ncbi:MAG: phosphoglycerate kinase [Puniceicoccales bacterium]|jgi:3-phosphoglycerate kinase|nr:phosphoglycerate kinase [Puniceicoccales bacterium]
MFVQRVKTVRDVNCSGKKVFVRVDFNVPLNEFGAVSDDARIVAALPTIEYLLQSGARVILASHFGRPNGERVAKYSMGNVAKILAQYLGQSVLFLPDCVGEDVNLAINKMTNGSVVLLENLRFYAEETKNDPNFAKQLASLAEIYVNDAFGTVHRAHASTEGITHFVKIKVAGLLIERELGFLGARVSDPERPFTVIFGGAKVSDKIDIINNLLDKADSLLIGGVMAFTFLAASGRLTGTSPVEGDKVKLAGNVLKAAKTNGVNILIPLDFIITDKFDAEKMTIGETKSVDANIPDGWCGIDIGPKTVEKYSNVIAHSRTILWNGPLGVFEIERAAGGTFGLAKAIASSETISIVGGGDLGKAIRKSGYDNYMTFISTGGGASLEFLKGKELPGIAALDRI